MGHFIGTSGLEPGEIRAMFALAEFLEKCTTVQRERILPGIIVASAFFQPSTRTRLAFESAAFRLGAQCIGFADPSVTRAGDYYNESLEDVVSNIGAVADLIVLRHYEAGAAERAAAVSAVPIVNAGDGYNEHPSQALGDVWTMCRILGDVAGATIGLLGDPAIRSLHSIGFVLSKLNIAKAVYLLAPGTTVPLDTLRMYSDCGVQVDYASSAEELLAGCDLLETIGVNHPNHQMARQGPPQMLSPTPERFRITKAVIAKVGRSVPILHPGPRTDEISTDVDSLELAKYIPQVRNGMWMKGAMMAKCLAGPALNVPGAS